MSPYQFCRRPHCQRRHWRRRQRDAFVPAQYPCSGPGCAVTLETRLSPGHPRLYHSPRCRDAAARQRRLRAPAGMVSAARESASRAVRLAWAARLEGQAHRVRLGKAVAVHREAEELQRLPGSEQCERSPALRNFGDLERQQVLQQAEWAAYASQSRLREAQAQLDSAAMWARRSALASIAFHKRRKAQAARRAETARDRRAAAQAQEAARQRQADLARAAVDLEYAAWLRQRAAADSKGDSVLLDAGNGAGVSPPAPSPASGGHGVP